MGKRRRLLEGIILLSAATLILLVFKSIEDATVARENKSEKKSQKWQKWQKWQQLESLQREIETSHKNNTFIGKVRYRSPEEILLFEAKRISKKHGFVNIQFLSRHFIEMTESWICNVKSMKQVLNATLFVASDNETHTTIKNFNGLDLNVVLVPFVTSGKLTYGKSEYYDFILYRTRFICAVLENGVNVWLTESDATWFESPFGIINYTNNNNNGGEGNSNNDNKNRKNKNGNDDIEFIAFVNNMLSKINKANGGFLYIKSTPKTRAVWQALLLWETVTLEGDRNEQAFLTFAIKEFRVKVRWLSRVTHVSGQWYFNQVFQTGKENIILNNWVKGNDGKIKRAKKFGHWFLSEDKKCIMPGDIIFKIKN